MRLLNLEEKRCSLSKALSGGMKRKLSIGIALIGDSKASGSLRPGGPVEPGGWSASEELPGRVAGPGPLLLHHQEVHW